MEEFLFPRFRQANKLVDLVEVLVMQHRAGRTLTETTLHLATPQALKRAEDRRALTNALCAFIRMYNPHEAHEDTVLFPAFRTIVTPQEYEALGEAFEQREHQLFGEHGFEQIVDRVAAIEKRLGIYTWRSLLHARNGRGGRHRIWSRSRPETQQQPSEGDEAP